MVPAIVYYELKRELLRANKTNGIARLDAFIAVTPGRYVPVSDEALRLAASMWAIARQQGRPTADAKELDIDVILAAQTLSYGPAADDVMVVTTNARHLAQFVTAAHWQDL